ncbi:hypothetical protein ACH4FX_06860 [Streptomyces sp. NPDC018019]|uniref:hypothetical protein n=1 Tax=Streptomyces sp. NPDC018019 TaxID=3365030 RepID=UPI0037897F3F
MTDQPALTVASQARAIHALAILADRFATLPSTSFTVGTVCGPDGIEEGIHIDLHTCAADFEAWRAALAIDPGGIEYSELSRCHSLRAYTAYEGVPVQLTGYLPYPSVAAA